MTDKPNPLLDPDPVVRRTALDALAPADSHGLLLLDLRPGSNVLSTSSRLDAGRMFAALLIASQMFGKALGLQLQWIPEPEDPNKLIVAQGM